MMEELKEAYDATVAKYDSDLLAAQVAHVSTLRGILDKMPEVETEDEKSFAKTVDEVYRYELGQLRAGWDLDQEEYDNLPENLKPLLEVGESFDESGS